MTKLKAIPTTLIVICGLCAAQSKPVTKPSLNDTFSWMTNFSADHGFVMAGNQIARRNFLTGNSGCLVTVRTDFFNAKRNTQIKDLSTTIELKDFDPDSAHVDVDKENATYEVDLERSDATLGVVEEAEMGDGKKSELHADHVEFFFDSETSAKRFARALSYATRLCGGTPVPF